MKRIQLATVSILIAITLTLSVMPVMAKPTSITVPSYRAQYSWCGWSGPQDMFSFATLSPITTDYRLTGNVLHMNIPSFYGAPGTLNYVYDHKTNLWTSRGEPVVVDLMTQYGYNVTVYFRGYLEFSDTPNAETFEHGALYEWVYVFAPESDTGVSQIWGNVKWDSTVGAWLISFNAVIHDSKPIPYTGPIALPTPMPSPTNDYNPLGV